jgi:hypothetical protein
LSIIADWPHPWEPRSPSQTKCESHDLIESSTSLSEVGAITPQSHDKCVPLRKKICFQLVLCKFLAHELKKNITLSLLGRWLSIQIGSSSDRVLLHEGILSLDLITTLGRDSEFR